MIERTQYLETIRERLKRFPVVSVLGPRQVGKTTLAQVIAGEQPSHFFDLEDVDAQTRLAEPKAALERLTGLVVLDEVQRMPDLFALLRVLADRKPVKARFLLTGSASPALVRGVSESLAGRVALVDVSGFNLAEVGEGEWRTLWWRGGFPLAYLAETDAASREWQEEFVRTLLERDMPQLGITIPAAALASVLDDADALPRGGVERVGAGAVAGRVRTDDAQVSGHPEFDVHGAAACAVA
jgi:uncharacterized protein